MQHPDMNSIEAYSRRSLTGAEMLALGDHIAACDACRGLLCSFAFQRPAGQDMASMLAEDVTLHLSQQEIVAAAGGGESLTADARVHLASCADCSAELDEVRRFYSPVVTMQPKIASPRRVPVSWMLWSGLAAAGIAFAVMTLHRHDASDRTVLVAQLHDAGGEIDLNARGGLSGVGAMSPEQSALLVQALTSHRLPSPDTVVGLSPSGEGLRDDGPEAAGFDVLTPRGEVTLPTPIFRWQALPQAQSYQVDLYDAGFKLVEQSPKLQETHWTPSQPLTPGGKYRWVVKAATPRGTVDAPRPPAVEARFVVGDAGSIASIEATRTQSPGAHLLLATLYAKAGMRSLARSELDALSQENPGSPLVQELSDSLKDGQFSPSSTKPAQ